MPDYNIPAKHRLGNALRLVILPLLVLSIASCAPLYFDPNAGAETVLVRSLDHIEHFDIDYVNDPVSDGPYAFQGHAWTVFWFVPLNRPDLGIWLREALPPESSPANVRAIVRTPWYGHLLYFPTLGMFRVQRVQFEADAVIVTPIEPE